MWLIVEVGADVQMKTRDELGTFLNSLGLLGTGAEIGVRYGSFALQILRLWQGAQLILVDPWRPSPTPYIDPANVSVEQYEDWHQRTRKAIKPYGVRAKVYRMLSLEAVELIGDGDLDFVFIDAMHTFEAVRSDLYAWWPKVRAGGLFSGHDYYNATAHPQTLTPVRDNSLPGRLVPYGVKTAVDEFAHLLGRNVSTTTADEFPTWYWTKS